MTDVAVGGGGLGRRCVCKGDEEDAGKGWQMLQRGSEAERCMSGGCGDAGKGWWILQKGLRRRCVCREDAGMLARDGGCCREGLRRRCECREDAGMLGRNGGCCGKAGKVDVADDGADRDLWMLEKMKRCTPFGG